MMEAMDVRAIVDQHAPRLKKASGIERWDVRITVERCPEQVKGQCEADPRYMIAEIQIDPEHAEDEDDVVKTLRHEMLHVLVSQFEVYRAAVHHLVDSEDALNAIDEVWTFATENVVHNIETALDQSSYNLDYMST